MNDSLIEFTETDRTPNADRRKIMWFCRTRGIRHELARGRGHDSYRLFVDAWAMREVLAFVDSDIELLSLTQIAESLGNRYNQVQRAIIALYWIPVVKGARYFEAKYLRDIARVLEIHADLWTSCRSIADSIDETEFNILQTAEMHGAEILKESFTGGALNFVRNGSAKVIISACLDLDGKHVREYKKEEEPPQSADLIRRLEAELGYTPSVAACVTALGIPAYRARKALAQMGRNVGS